MNAASEVMRNAFVMVGSFLLAIIAIVLIVGGLFWFLKSQLTPEKIAGFLFGG